MTLFIAKAVAILAGGAIFAVLAFGFAFLAFLGYLVYKVLE